MKTCPFCAEDIKDAAIVCKHCGRDLPAATAPPPLAQTPQSVGTTAVTPVRPGWPRWKKALLAFGMLAFVGVGLALEPWGEPTGRAASSRRSALDSRPFAILDSASDEQRQEILRNLIESSGSKCREVTRAFRQGDNADVVFWNATCFQGQSYSVMVTKNATGSGKVTECRVLERVTRTKCFEPFRYEPK